MICIKLGTILLRPKNLKFGLLRGFEVFWKQYSMQHNTNKCCSECPPYISKGRQCITMSKIAVEINASLTLIELCEKPEQNSGS